MKRIWSIVYILVISAFLIEMTGLFIFDNRYFWERRYLYLSSDSILNETSVTKSFWKYQPNSAIRSVAVYQRAFNPIIEYDCKFDTNSYGFVDTGPISDVVDFLVLGDSFTEGQGGCPWLTKDSLIKNTSTSGLSIANGGLQGAGILTFEQVLNYFEANTSIKNLIIIAISNDFKRGDAQIWPTDTECYLFGSCKDPSDLWHHIPFYTSDVEIVENARNRNHDRGLSTFDWLLQRSFTYHLYSKYKVLIHSFISPESNVISVSENAAFDANFEALQRIRSRFPKLTVILVSMRDEVGILGRKNSDTLRVEEYLRENKFQYHECKLGSGDFMPLDGHPNKQGYNKMLNCLERTILNQSGK